MNEFLQQLANACVPVLCLLITAGGAYLVALLRKRTAMLQQELNNNFVNKYIGMAVDAVDQAVTYVAQTFVDALKAENAFTVERQLEAFDMAKNKVIEILGDTAIQCLNVVYGDFEVWLETRIEQVCREIKTVDAPTPLMLLPSGFEVVNEDVLRAMNDDTPPTSTPDEWPKPLPEEATPEESPATEEQPPDEPEVEDPNADYEY